VFWTHITGSRLKRQNVSISSLAYGLDTERNMKIRQVLVHSNVSDDLDIETEKSQLTELFRACKDRKSALGIINQHQLHVQHNSTFQPCIQLLKAVIKHHTS
jgi:hypothetical protein